jgi:hypothetical protein
MPTRTVEFDEAKIDKTAKADFLWDASPCDLEGHDLGVHTWLKFKVTTDDSEGVTSVEVIDCDRKDEPR